MRGKWYKTKIPLNLSLIVIHWKFYDYIITQHDQAYFQNNNKLNNTQNDILRT